MTLIINKQDILKTIYEKLPQREREYGETFEDIDNETEKGTKVILKIPLYD